MTTTFIMVCLDAIENPLACPSHTCTGYFIHAAAIIASLDPKWLQLNAPWVNALIRDANSPSSSDPQFPFSRMFDWYHGHSFAKGLFESADSKDEESTSEDAFFAYAIKMWGEVTGDQSMEARGNLMLGVLARTFDNYFLMRKCNTNQPANFIANKVTGIVSSSLSVAKLARVADIVSFLKIRSIILRISAPTLSIFKAFTCFHFRQ